MIICCDSLNVLTYQLINVFINISTYKLIFNTIMNKTTRLIPLLALIALTCGKAEAQDTVRLTLDSCLRYAYQNNLQAQNAKLSIQSAQVTVESAKMNFLPSVNATASQSVSWADQTQRSANYGVNGSLTLFDGLAKVRTLQQTRLAERQSNLMLQQVENNIGAQIISAYLTVMMNKEKLAYQQEVLATTHTQQQEGELKYSVGRILESDYNLLVANYQNALAETENTRLTIENSRLALKTLLCIEDNIVVDVEPTELSIFTLSQSESNENTFSLPSQRKVNEVNFQLPTLDTVLAQSRRALPDWQISSLNVDIAQNKVQQAWASFLPSLSLNAGTSYGEGGGINGSAEVLTSGGLNTTVTLGLSIPILNRGSSLTQLRQSKIDLQQAELEHRQKTIDLQQEIERHYIATLQALNRYRSAETMSRAYRGSYEIYVLKYAEGVVTTVEMLQQQDKYLSALNDYLQSKYTLLLYQRQLDIYTGNNK